MSEKRNEEEKVITPPSLSPLLATQSNIQNRWKQSTSSSKNKPPNAAAKIPPSASRPEPAPLPQPSSSAAAAPGITPTLALAPCCCSRLKRRRRRRRWRSRIRFMCAGLVAVGGVGLACRGSGSREGAGLGGSLRAEGEVGEGLAELEKGEEGWWGEEWEWRGDGWGWGFAVRVSCCASDRRGGVGVVCWLCSRFSLDLLHGVA